ncbi:acyl-CoA carboxylase subunit epsilon, partial [Streptomyces sp. T-3]|nr:acyl-CoA carboxylase subunit epsilon [Streptomyces sp. T-3]
MDAAGFRIESGHPDATELAAVIAVLCARNAAVASGAAAGP